GLAPARGQPARRAARRAHRVPLPSFAPRGARLLGLPARHGLGAAPRRPGGARRGRAGAGTLGGLGGGRSNHGGCGERSGGCERRRHRLLRTTVEYNYGLTDKIDVAAYTDLARENGDELEYAGSRVRARGALFEKGRYPLDLGWYVEAEIPHRGESDLELEFRPILSRDLGRFSVDLNPSFELPTVTEERRTLEFNYGARVYYRLSRDFVPGIEFFGAIGQIRRPDAAREQEHYVVPVLYGQLARGLKFVAGPGVGPTRASDPVILRLGVEYEFTLAGGGGGGPARPTY